MYRTNMQIHKTSKRSERPKILKMEISEIATL